MFTSIVVAAGLEKWGMAKGLGCLLVTWCMRRFIKQTERKMVRNGLVIIGAAFVVE